MTTRRKPGAAHSMECHGVNGVPERTLHRNEAAAFLPMGQPVEGEARQ